MMPMDKISQARFDAIMSKDISAVTDTDRVFLRARRDYLTPDQQEAYLDPSYKPAKQGANKGNNKLARFRELMARAKAEGIIVQKGIKLDELEALLA